VKQMAMNGVKVGSSFTIFLFFVDNDNDDDERVSTEVAFVSNIVYFTFYISCCFWGY